MCLQDGTWNGSVPLCKRKSVVSNTIELFSKAYLGRCKEISSPELQCHPSCSGVAGDEVHLSCINGYVLQGALSLKCGADGKWNNAIPSCKKSCLMHPIPDNGSCIPSNCSGTIGDQITFACNDGYRLHGSAKLSCLTGGVWSDAGNITTTCKGKQ